MQRGVTPPAADGQADVAAHCPGPRPQRRTPGRSYPPSHARRARAAWSQRECLAARLLPVMLRSPPARRASRLPGVACSSWGLPVVFPPQASLSRVLPTPRRPRASPRGEAGELQARFPPATGPAPGAASNFLPGTVRSPRFRRPFRPDSNLLLDFLISSQLRLRLGCRAVLSPGDCNLHTEASRVSHFLFPLRFSRQARSPWESAGSRAVVELCLALLPHSL